MKKNDFVLPIIIILLLFFVPCSIYGINRHKADKNDRGNPNHLPKVGNTLYFYDKANKELLGTYECEKDNCNRAITSIDDINVHEEDEGNIIPYVNDEYVFINDGDIILMYVMKSNKTIAKLKLIKNYGIGIQDNMLIMKYEDDTYGLYSMTNAQFVITPSEGYTYMGLLGNKTNDGKVSTEKIIVRKDSLYLLIDIDGNELSEPSTNPIYYYEDDYIYYKNTNDIYIITDYTLNKIVDDLIIDIHIFPECNVFINNDNVLKVYSKDYQNLIFEKQYETTDFTFEIKDDRLTIKEKDSKRFEEIRLSSNNEEEIENTKNNEEQEDEETE